MRLRGFTSLHLKLKRLHKLVHTRVCGDTINSLLVYIKVRLPSSSFVVFNLMIGWQQFLCFSITSNITNS
jgi:hypothetical protein